jgi:excisionase family DNA binding protein
MIQRETEYLTTKELAELLRIKERRVYDLAAAGQIPCSRVLGKLLFPRREIDSWLAGGRSGGLIPTRAQRPRVFLGSHEPLLEWALRESGCGLATLLDGSLDGLERFANGEGVASGLHLFDPRTGDWNTAQVEARFAHEPVVLVEFAWRERGLIVHPGREEEFRHIGSLQGRRVVPRQRAAGSQVLLEHLIRQAGLEAAAIDWTETARTESEAALAVLEGKADVALGLRALALQLNLAFTPLVRERFDVLVDRAAWFDPPLQHLWNFCHSSVFRSKSGEFAGYEVDGLGTVHFNGGKA